LKKASTQSLMTDQERRAAVTEPPPNVRTHAACEVMASSSVLIAPTGPVAAKPVTNAGPVSVGRERGGVLVSLVMMTAGAGMGQASL
jgi:hypothetical protein